MRSGLLRLPLARAASYMSAHGEVPEWSNGTVSKTVVRVTVPWVRIPTLSANLPC